MNLNRSSFGWSGLFLGVAAVSLAMARKRRDALAAQRLEGKVVLITGGSRGLGFAIAQQLGSLGARLVLTARHPDELQAARDRLLLAGRLRAEDVLLLPCDVSAPEEIRQVVHAATAHFGQIDVLVNNAGIILVGPLESQTLQSFHDAMNINFFGALHTTLAVLPQMMARGDGAIVNIASIGGKVAFPHLLPYVASKFALVGWSQGLRAELRGKGIHVTTVNPGVMRTGSHVQARFAGDVRKEYRWFASAASSPATATDAATAARKVIRGLLRGSAEISIGLQAIVAARTANLAPEWTAAFLSAANSLLPEAPAGQQFWDADRSVQGKAFRGSLPAILERAGTRAMNRYNQESQPSREEDSSAIPYFLQQN